MITSAIRKFAYATLLVASIFNYAPNLAAEESGKGRFKLTHEVRWQGINVPAGDYEFAYQPDSISPVLTLTKVNGPRTSFMVFVPTKEDSVSPGSNLLVLESTAAGSYVSAMKLPEIGVTLYFRVPREAEKQMAKAVTTVASSGK